MGRLWDRRAPGDTRRSSGNADGRQGAGVPGASRTHTNTGPDPKVKRLLEDHFCQGSVHAGDDPHQAGSRKGAGLCPAPHSGSPNAARPGLKGPPAPPVCMGARSVWLFPACSWFVSTSFFLLKTITTTDHLRHRGYSASPRLLWSGSPLSQKRRAGVHLRCLPSAVQVGLSQVMGWVGGL